MFNATFKQLYIMTGFKITIVTGSQNTHIPLDIEISTNGVDVSVLTSGQVNISEIYFTIYKNALISLYSYLHSYKLIQDISIFQYITDATNNEVTYKFLLVKRVRYITLSSAASTPSFCGHVTFQAESAPGNGMYT